MAQIRSFGDPLPSVVYWDTNFIVNFVYEGSLFHQQTVDFLARLDASSTISYFSTLTLDEVYFILLQVSIERDHGPRSFWRTYQANPAIIVPYLDVLDELTEEWLTHPRLRVVAAEPTLSLDVLANMRRYRLLPRDSFHLAMMRQHGVGTLVTLDADFLAVPDLTVFTCVPSMLKQAAES